MFTWFFLALVALFLGLPGLALALALMGVAAGFIAACWGL
jgi:hypothetical protein